MTDKDIILSALNKPNPTKRRPKQSQSFDEDNLSFIPDDDPIIKEGKRQERQNKWRKKLIKNWSPIDFVRYTKHLLNLNNVFLTSYNNVRYNAANVDRTYDMLAKDIENMNNHILKEYYEWWVSVKAHRYQGKDIRMGYMSQKEDVKRFILINRSSEEILEVILNQNTEVSNEELYKSGLPLLLMNRGIVESYSFLCQKGKKDVMPKIIKALNSLSKKILIGTLEITISKTYLQSDIVDFITLAKPALKIHMVNNFEYIDYRDYFG